MSHVLVVGNGARAHALAWKLTQSPHVSRLSVAPGNGGTAALAGARNVPVDATDVVSLLDFAQTEAVDLTVVGPEEPLAGGLVDQFEAVGLRIFGPRRAASLIEASKSHAKMLMARCGVPTPPYEVFTDLDAALDYVMSQPVYDLVIKADGLARGKGVFLPRGEADAEGILRALLERDALGPAGRRVIIEQRLSGAEVSVHAFTDGETIVPMPPLCDYKRLLDGDQGPNTGGMGAVAPTAALTPALLGQVHERILRPILAELRADGLRFKGVLYVDVMLVDGQPVALALNARLGDPAAQTLLPLLQTDLFEVLEACVDERLSALPVSWSAGAAVTVVLTTAGYPYRRDPGLPIHLGPLPAGVLVFHSGTRRTEENQLVTTGGRVLAITGVAQDVPTATERAYQGVSQASFPGMHFRRDIGSGVGCGSPALE
ncbi:MAG: phosphoribosylamine--glycine ligase [Anaerolineae bacterium]